jgi:hypothetical protein
MILYTPLPLEQVLEGFDKAPAPYEEIQLGGLTMQLEPNGPYSGKIVRMISPNPNDYLNPAYAPGQVIRFYPDQRQS